MMMRPLLVLALIAAAVSPAAAQEPAIAAATANGAADRLIAALNGTAADRAAFVASGFTKGALAREDAGARAALLDRLAAQAGGFRVLERKPNGDRMVELTLATAKGGRFGRAVLFTARAEPGRIADLFFVPARDPAKAARDAWPTSPVPADRIAHEIGRRLDALAADDAFSGAVLVARGDRVLLRRAYGDADAGWGAPNTPDTRFNIASVGKMFTAAAVLKLVEQGRVSLDDTLARWAPDYPHRDAAARITVRHLLTHSAGLGPWDGRKLSADTSREAARTMTEPPIAEPGARFEYSNAGYVLLGAVVEAATGEPFRDAVHRLVFEPLAMRRTDFAPVSAVERGRATGYLRPADDPFGFGPRFANDQFLGYRGDASGGGYSTVDDLFAFTRALRAGRVLSPALTAEMLADRVDFAGAPRPTRYGYGVARGRCAGRPSFGHSGGGPNSGVSDVVVGTTDGEWTMIVLSNYDAIGEEVATGLCDFVALHGDTPRAATVGGR